jgi:hypothetical protein
MKSSAKYSLKGKHYLGTSISINQDGSHEKMSEGINFQRPGPNAYRPNMMSIFPSTSTRFG